MMRRLRAPRVPLPPAAALVLAALVLSSAPARAQQLDLPALIDEAGRMFHDAANTEDQAEAHQLYQGALDRYREAVEVGGVRNGGLLYDIGNAYVSLGDIGRGILYYRRAELLIPADRNLGHNLRYARTLRADNLPWGQPSDAARILLFWHYLLSPLTRLILFIAAFAAACVLTALHVLRRARWKRAVAVTAAAVALLFGGSLAVSEIRLLTMRDGVVTADEVVVRKGDGTAYERSFLDPLHSGAEFSLLEEREGWLFIQLSDGRSGWIPSSAAEMVRSPTGGNES